MQTATASTTTAGRTSGRDPRPPGAGWGGPRVFDARPETVRIFDAEPDLLAGLDERAADFLRRRAIVPKLWLDKGVWSPPLSSERLHYCFGLLVIDGLMFRTVELDGRCCPELLGAGDLLRPWDDAGGSVAHATSWNALQPTALAVLDDRFTDVVRRFPSIMVELLSRSVQRSRSLAFSLAIAHVRHADVRLHILFWHLADRWGRVTPAGVHVPLRLTHEMLAQLACMRRPTASTALNRLSRSGELVRRTDGTWLLTGTPPARRAPGPGAT